MFENPVGAVQAFALLIPVVLKGSRMKVTDDADDVNIGAPELLKIFRKREEQRWAS